MRTATGGGAVRRDAQDQVGEVAAALADDGVHVHPSLASTLGPQQEAALEQAVADAPVPLFVVVHPLAYDGPFGGRADELLTLVHDRTGEPGLYLAVGDLGTEHARLEGLTWDVQADAWQVTWAATEQHPTDGVAALLEAADIVADGREDEAYAEASALAEDRAADDPATGTSTTDPGTGASAGDDGLAGSALLGVGLVGVLVVAAVLRTRRRPSAPASGWQLPASALARVRTAEDQRLTQQARQEVLALGEALDAREIGARDDRAGWQSALDHYEAATRLLDRPSGDGSDGSGGSDGLRVLDVVGATVLARRGRDALHAARAGTAFRPAEVCFLDPLHPAPRERGRVEVGGQAVEVPLCRACRTALREGREPDVLDVLRDGRPVHYLDTDTVWARTGYGALLPDLLAELRTRPGT